MQPSPICYASEQAKKIYGGLMKKMNVIIVAILGTCGDMEACRCCLPYVHSTLSYF